MKRKLIKKSVRVDKDVLEQLKVLLGIPDESKVIRAAMNFTNNVARNMFSGNLSNMFKRRKDNEEIALYDKQL